MRNIQKLIAFVFVFVVWSCTTDNSFFDAEKDESTLLLKGNNTQGNIPKNMPVYSQNELIIQYKPGTPDAMKSTIRLTHGINPNSSVFLPNFGIYEICRCDNKDIEKWTFDGAISIEPKKGVIEGEIDGEAYGIGDVDYEFVFGFDAGSPIVGTVTDTFYESYIKEDNVGVTIAILDTGVATGLTVFNTETAADKFLYDATDTAIGEEQSGWDFVNGDPNAFDDDPYMHGSIVASQIHNTLKLLGVTHQILPIKIAGVDGNISYFDMLCGTLYAAERSQIINASFGWQGDPFGDFGNTILENVLEMFPDVTLVASAGNTSSNNDTTPHYPSSFSVTNLIGVGSCNQGYGQVSDFSNYGVSVDFYAKGEGIPFFDSFVAGTSFSAPQITIEVAKIIESDVVSDLPMVDRVAALGFPATITFQTVIDPYTGESVIKNTLYNRYILSDD